MLAKVLSAAALGIEALPVEIETDICNGMPREQIVGLPDAAVKESIQRVRSAMGNAGYAWPSNKRMTINLAPAGIRKEGPLYDLPIALGILAASELVSHGKMSEYLFTGELALDGRLRPVKGVLLYAMLAKAQGKKGIVCPEENSAEASVVEGLEVIPVATLSQAAAFLNGRTQIAPRKSDAAKFFNGARDFSMLPDMADVRGQETVKRALTIAASGGHNVVMFGPPGSGKSMLAKRLPSILPPLTMAEALETAKIWSVAGKLSASEPLVRGRPFRDPHHTTSYAGLVGGGQDPRPGEISLGHNGVIFLDEFPEFDSKVKEALRQPLEDRKITISRSSATCVFPANIMLVAAMNPCPCGHYGSGRKKCTCSDIFIQRYLGKISGPLLDRIDIQAEVQHVPYEELSGNRTGPGSAEIREQVAQARTLQTKRYEGTGIYCNAAMNERQLQEFCRPDKSADKLLKQAVDSLGYSARSYSRILKVARTIADLEGASGIESAHVAEALQYRSLDRLREM